MLPAEHRAAITRAEAGEAAEDSKAVRNGVLVVDDAKYQQIKGAISPDGFAGLTDAQIDHLVRLQEQINDGQAPAVFCFTPDTNQDYAEAVDAMLRSGPAIAFQQIGRWQGTALTPTSNSQGEPLTITYSFVPDDTTVPADVGFNGGPSRLFQWLNGLYESEAEWQQIFHDEFARWGNLINVTYVFEPNDDGTATSGLPGQAGLRGDVRIGAIPLDGNSGVLAYNNFPNNGDMIFDAFDSFYSNFSNNNRRLRNIIAHEHGHGLGMLHVCPANETKLMEPFISTAYLGPQLDDILNGQRHYGDLNEPNDSTGTATDLGSVSIGSVLGESNVSIDDNADSDVYRVEATEPLELRVTVSPSAATYDQAPQDSFCDTGISTNYNTIHDLRIDAFDDQGNPLGSADFTGRGSSETLSVQLQEAGTYFVRVRGDNANSIQLYGMAVTTTELPFLAARYTDALLTDAVDPGESVDIAFNLTNGDETLQATPRVRYRFDGGAFLSIDAIDLGGGAYQASLPAAFCADSPEYFVETDVSLSGQIFLPPLGAAAPIGVSVGRESPLDDDFESDRGWTVSGPAGDAFDGRWDRGIPAGGGDRADPPIDADGSGSAFLTGNADGNTDVDDLTILTSPRFDAATFANATISYSRWFSNDEGGSPSEDVFVVEISNNDGANWVNLETVGPTGTEASGGWFSRTFNVADFLLPTVNMRVRFIADDTGAGSLVEAGVDGFLVGGDLCIDPEPSMACNAADIAAALGALDVNDVIEFVNAFNSGGALADIAPPGGDGSLNVNDVIEFVNAFNAGCP
jgi:hypothetical protein